MKCRWAKDLTGGSAGYLDNIYADDLVDGDLTIVAILGSGVSFYIYDDDNAGAESSPDIIAPDNASSGVPYTGDGRHVLKVAWNGDVSDIDLDGSSDIGEALADADLILVDNGAGGTNVKSAVSRIWTYITGKIQGLSAKTTPVAADILTIQDTETSNALKEVTLTNVMKGLPDVVGDSGAGGTKGAVPAPGAGDAAAGKYLDADGTWTVPPDTNTVYDGAITDLEIDGADDIGEALADADLLIVDNGAGGTNVKSAISRVWTYVIGKIQGLAAKTTPVTADILTIQDTEASNALKELTIANLRLLLDGINVATYGSAQTLTTTECTGYVVYVTGAAVITLPAIASGMSVVVVTIGDVAVSANPNDNDKIYLDGTALDDGDKITNNSLSGDIAVLTYYSADGWYASTNGWADGGA